jgi:ribosome biogenesis protein Tsr3
MPNAANMYITGWTSRKSECHSTLDISKWFMSCNQTPSTSYHSRNNKANSDEKNGKREFGA